MRVIPHQEMVSFDMVWAFEKNILVLQLLIKSINEYMGLNRHAFTIMTKLLNIFQTTESYQILIYRLIKNDERNVYTHFQVKIQNYYIKGILLDLAPIAAQVCDIKMKHASDCLQISFLLFLLSFWQYFVHNDLQ